MRKWSRGEKLELREDVWHKMLMHAVSERPRESCGLLVIDGVESGIRYEPCVNVVAEEDREHRYSFDVETLADHFSSVVGVVHSHPRTPAIPSGIDRAGMVPGLLYVISSVLDGDVHAWVKTRMGSEVELFQVPIFLL